MGQNAPIIQENGFKTLSKISLEISRCLLHLVPIKPRGGTFGMKSDYQVLPVLLSHVSLGPVVRKSFHYVPTTKIIITKETCICNCTFILALRHFHTSPELWQRLRHL